jgi:putative copper export protein
MKVMPRNGTFLASLKVNKRWADAASLVSIVLVVGLLSIAAFLADSMKADVTTRIGMLIVMATVIIVVCIWQAAAFIAASIDAALEDRRKGGRPLD